MILAALAMHYMNHHPKYSTVAYCVSQLLDAVDGHAARYLGQASKFGAVLDMVTDRCVFVSYPSSRLSVEESNSGDFYGLNPLYKSQGDD